MNDPIRRRVMTCEPTIAALTLLASPLVAYAQAPGPAPTPASFTAEQAARGRVEYERSCIVCHGENLAGGPFAQPLTGSRFRDRWAGHSMDRLFTQVRTTMPPDRAGQLSRQTYADLLSYILEVNGAPASDQALPAESEALAALFVPVGGRSSMQAQMRSSGPGGFFADGVELPEWPAAYDPLVDFAGVTDAVLENPPAESWLHWRGDYESLGFSRLDQIDKDNVSRLSVAWTLSLPPGPNESTPLVHDGVMFVHSYGDHILALNAATGDELWHYARELPEGSSPSVKRNISIYGDRIYAATSDGHVVALDARTGNVVWNRRIDGNPRLTGGPLVARGVVMQGTDGRRPGGGFLQAFAADTGAPLWRFNAIPRPGEPGGDSWNGLPWEERSGGTIWTSGGFDPRTGLAYIGPAPTYDTGPLLTPIGQAGITNDALYTNSTVALEPATGRIAWHFQHLANDQFDLDWAFERTIIDLEIDGVPRRVLVTAGKGGFHDALDASSGQYLFSFDMGLQNFILGANRETGEKRIDESLLPDTGEGRQTKTICPHAGGGRSWIPSALNPQTRILYVPAVETCMDLVPAAEGEGASLTSGYQWRLRPRPDSDGRYGRIQAIDVATGETLWTERQRAPQSTGVLATAGGLVFAGALDRWLTAYDDATGAPLWRTRLNDVPNSNPISYEVDGTQYVAIVVGYGGAQVASFPRLTPEIPLPATRSSAVWVFELK